MAKLRPAVKPVRKPKVNPSGNGATEDQVDMRDTVPEHIDNKGTKVEDIAGTGEVDAKGG